MGTSLHEADAGSDRARRLLSELGREVRAARMDRGLSTREAGRAAGMSSATVSRLERGLLERATLADLAILHAVVGLELSARSYPGGQPIRDAAHVALLGSLRSRLHASLSWRTEVPLPDPNDQRSWDATIRGPGFLYGVEAETAPRDAQALLRRLKLKERDAGVDGLVLLLAETKHSRSFMAGAAEMLATEFPQPGRRALALLAGGLDPGGSSIVVLRPGRR